MANENSEFENCFRYYEKAIELRNLHYNNYNQWVNLYSIFTGALFIGFYSIQSNHVFYIELILCFLGVITSICWLQSVRGFYYWMRSHIHLVQEYENKLEELRKEKNNSNLYCVYKYLNQSDENIWAGNISTQKITVFFIIVIIVAWNLIFIRLLINNFSKIISFFINEPKPLNINFNDSHIFFLIVFLCFMINLITFYITNTFKSNISMMEKSVSKK